MKSPTIWVSFLRVPKSPVRGNGGYAGFFAGDGSPCNIAKNYHSTVTQTNHVREESTI
jgi:hypothetical protein